MGRRLIPWLAVPASVGLHLGALWVASAIGRAAPSAQLIDVRVLEAAPRITGVLGDGISRYDHGTQLRDNPQTPRLGGQRDPAPDTLRQGAGQPSAKSAVNLASHMSELSLSREPHNQPERSQVQRVQSSTQRASKEHMRTALEPMQLSFISTGSGQLRQRAQSADFEPSVGARSMANSQAFGGQQAPDEPGVAVSSRVAGSREARERQGLTHAAGKIESTKAPVVRARPDVRQDSPSIVAEERARTQDNADSTQAVSERVAAMISSSSLGGRRGPGEGGQTSERGAGTGGPEVGSRSRHSGSRPGGLSDTSEDPAVERYHGYLNAVLKRYSNRHFPDWAKAKGHGGLAIISFVVNPQGRLQHIRVARPSGISEYDGNLVAALQRTQLRPPPAGPLKIRFRFDAVNTMIPVH